MDTKKVEKELRDEIISTLESIGCTVYYTRGELRIVDKNNNVCLMGDIKYQGKATGLIDISYLTLESGRNVEALRVETPLKSYTQ